jgi:dimeric dUTPase (all-alpha-NTP-PPase superfamily)
MRLLELAKELDFNTEEDYINYIVESLINGQRKQVKELMMQIDYRDIDAVKLGLLHLATEKQLIEICKIAGMSKTEIENIYFDNWEPVPHIED